MAPRVLAVAVAGALTLWLGAAAGLNAEPAPAPSAEGGFRRVYVPAKRPEVWPVAGERYLPIAKGELAQLLRQQESSTAARVTAITLTGTINEAGNLVGRGELQVETSGPGAAFVPWPNRILKIQNARWIGSEVAGEEDVALVGLWKSSSNAESRYGLAAPTTGRLAFEFKTPATTDESPRFRVELPDSLNRELWLTLPRDVEPISSTAIISKAPARRRNAAERDLVDGGEADAKHNTDGVNLWVIRPLADEELSFTTSAAPSAGNVGFDTPRSTPVTLSSETQVSLSPRGADVQTVLRVGSSTSLPESLVIEAPSSLAMMEARVDGKSVEWRALNSEGPSTSIAIPLTERIEAHRAQIELTAWSLTPESGDWQAPLIQAPNLFWEEGALRLRVSPEVSIVDVPQRTNAALHLLQASNEVSDGAARAARGREFAFQFLTPDPTITFTLAPVERRVVGRVDQACEVSDTEVLSLFTLQIAKKPVIASSTLTALVDAEWVIESVESEPAGLVRDWFLAEPSSPGKGPDRSERPSLIIELATGDGATSPEYLYEEEDPLGSRAKATGPQAVRIACRRLAPPEAQIALSDLTPLRLLGATISENRLRLSTTGPDEIVLRPNDRDLPTPPAASRMQEGWTVDLSGSAGEELAKKALVELRPRPRQFEGDIRTTIESTPQGWRYRTTLSIQSPRGRAGPLLCYFYPPLSGASSQPLKWRDASGAPIDATIHSPQSKPKQNQRAETPASTLKRNPADAGEWWSIRPPTTSGSAVTLTVETILIEGKQIQVPLASLPQANALSSDDGQMSSSRQTGRVDVGGIAGGSVRLRHQGLSVEPLGRPSGLAYSYSPDAIGRSTPPTLSLETAPSQLTITGPAAPLKLTQLKTVWSPRESTLHVAHYNAVAELDRFRFSLPAKAKLIGVTDTSDRPFRITEAPPSRSEASLEYSAEAAADEGATDRGDSNQFPKVQRDYKPRRISITYRMPAERSSFEAVAVLPDCHAIQSDWDWQLLAPAPWQPTAMGYGNRNWRVRLFGALAQPSRRQPFNPLRQADWKAVAQSATQVITEPQLASGAALSRLRGKSPSSRHSSVTGTPALAGWQTFSFDGANSSSPPVPFTDDTQRHAWLGALQMVVMALAAWRLPRWGRGGMIAITAALLAALLVPDAFSGVASAVWFGLVLAWPCRWLVDRIAAGSRGREARSASTSSPSRIAGGAAGIAFWLLPLMLTGSLVGQAPESRLTAAPPAFRSPGAPLPPADVPEPLLIPINEAGGEVGDKVYARESFLARLLAEQRVHQSKGPTDVLIEGADYQGELLRDRPDQPLRAGRWTTTMRLRTLQRGAVLRLPMPPQGATWPATVSIDGLPAALKWESATEASFVIPEPGPCEVSYSYEPQIAAADGESCIQFPRLAAPGSKLLLRYPPTIEGLRIPFAEVVEQVQPGRISALLGVHPQLLVCWPDKPAAPDPFPESIDLMQQIEITRGGVRMLVKAVGEIDNKALTVTAPLGWRRAEKQQEQVALPTSTEEVKEGNLLAEFVAERSSPLGVVRVPAIEARGAAVRRRLVAVLVEPGLRCRAINSAPSRPIEAAEFVSLWRLASAVVAPISKAFASVPSEPNPLDSSEPRVSPDETAQINSEPFEASPQVEPPAEDGSLGADQLSLVAELESDIDWPLRVQPATARLRTSPHLDVAIGVTQTRYRLRLPKFESYGPLVTIEAPAGFQVERVRIGPGVDAAAEWSQPQPTRLVILQPARLAADAWLEVSGHGPPTKDRLPRMIVSSDDAAESVTDISLYREEEVLARFAEPIPQRTSESMAPPKAWRVRTVAAVRLDDNAPSPVLEVKENRLRLEAQSLTAFSLSEDSPTVAWSAEVRVQQGVLGELSLATPAWLALEQSQLAAPAGATLLAGARSDQQSRGARQSWIVRLARPAPAGSIVRLDLRVPRANQDRATEISATGDAVFEGLNRGALAAPLFRLPQASVVRPRIAIPSPTTGAPRVRWSVRGMRRIATSRAGEFSLPAGNWRLFEIDDRPGDPNQDSPRVFWSSVRPSPGEPRVPLAEFQLNPHPEVEPVLAAEFLVEPRGAMRCLLRVGAEDQLQSITIDGQPTQAVEKAPGVWDLELSDSRRPQIVNTIVVGSASSGRVTPPHLATVTLATTQQPRAIPPEVSLWAVREKDSLTVTAPRHGRLTTPQLVRVVKLRALMQSVQEASAPSAEWLRLWRPRMATALRAVEKAYAIEPVNEMTEKASRATITADGLTLDDARQSASRGNLKRPANYRAPVTLLRDTRQWLAKFASKEERGGDVRAAQEEAPLDDGEHSSAEPDSWVYFIETPASAMANSLPGETTAVEGPHVSAPTSGIGAMRLVLALAAVGALVALTRAPPGANFRGFAYEHRHALVALGGVGWWLFLSPSIVGFLLLVASAVGQVRLLWRQTVPPAR